MLSLPLYVLVLGGLVGLAVFIGLQPRWKVLVAFVVLSSCMDLLPTIAYGFYVRDAGFVLMFIAWLQLLGRRRVARIPPAVFTRLVQLMVVWAIVCVAYGVVVNGYPLLLTLKASRQWILGYATLFVFLRLYETDPGSCRFLLRWLYRITYVLVPLVLIQYALRVEIFYGLVREYGGAIRALPVFLPVALMFAWYIVARVLAGQRVAWHELAYVVLTVVMTALTYTRGIYLAAIAISLATVMVLAWSRRLVVNRVLGYLAGAVLALAVLLASGAMDRVVNRFLSGIDVLGGAAVVERTYVDDVDTFTGRLLVAGERIALSAAENPLFGFAFIHETIVPSAVRASLRHGGPIYTEEYQKLYAMGMPFVTSLHQFDIGWGDVATDMGLPALGLLLAMMFGVLRYQATTVLPRRLTPEAYFLATGMFLQLAMLMLLMFNGNPYLQNVHIVCFMLASLAFLGREVPAEGPVATEFRALMGLAPGRRP